MQRIGHAEGAIAVPARPLEGRAVPLAADPAVGDLQAAAVDRHEPIDRRHALRPEEVLDAPQVAEPLLPHRPDKRDGAWRGDSRLLQRPHDAEQHGQAATIVGDPRSVQPAAAARDPHGRAFGKHRVQMGAEHQMRTVATASPLADDVADGIDAHLAEPQGLERLPVHLGAGAFLEGWCRHLAQSDLPLEDPGLERRGPAERGGDVGASQQAPAEFGGSLLAAGDAADKAEAAHQQGAQEGSSDRHADRHRLKGYKWGRRGMQVVQLFADRHPDSWSLSIRPRPAPPHR